MGLIFGGDVTKVWDATASAASGEQAPHELGAIARKPSGDGSGDRWFVFVENTSGAPVPVGSSAIFVPAGGFSVQVAPVLSAPHMPCKLAGVAQVALANNKRGWVQSWGRGVVLADGAAIIAGDVLISSGSVPGAMEEATLGTSDYAAVAVARETIADTTTGAADICIRHA